jgi:RNA polymerase sigma-70 factor (ECF subfamily)
LLAWRNGDNTAGRTFLERHQAMVRRVFLNKVGSAAEVETLSQRTFATARADEARRRDVALVRTWLLAVARDVLLRWRDELGRHRRLAHLDDASAVDLGLGPSPAAAASDDERRMLEALRRMPLESQLVLELSYIEGSSAHELAGVLGCLEVGARMHLQRGRAALREALSDASPQQLEAWGRAVRNAWDR